VLSAEAWEKQWRDASPSQTACRDVKAGQCHGGPGAWDDMRALFAGTSQVSEAYVAVLPSSDSPSVSLV
jgi:hypothetical protein